MQKSAVPSAAPRGILSGFGSQEISLLRAWLPATHTKNKGYHHLAIVEDPHLRERAIPILAEYVRRAHSLALVRLHEVYPDTLDPRRRKTRDRVFASYPAKCDGNILKGFFGEIFAGLVAELESPGQREWHVPAFAFHDHNLLFEELIRQAADARAKRTFGRFGDDCLAFALDKNTTTISHILIAEAKCTHTHDADLLNAAFSKLGDQPIDVSTLWITVLIEGLKNEGSSDSTTWAFVLAAFRDSNRLSDRFRNDLVSYVHGDAPKRKKHWMDATTPHSAYKAPRHITTAEIKLSDVEGLIQGVYAVAFP